jgi:hypothetical protein
LNVRLEEAQVAVDAARNVGKCTSGINVANAQAARSMPAPASLPNAAGAAANLPHRRLARVGCIEGVRLRCRSSAPKPDLWIAEYR